MRTTFGLSHGDVATRDFMVALFCPHCEKHFLTQAKA
jgi:hypothetical protein